MSRRLRCRSFSVLSGLFLIGLACLSMADSDGEAPVTFVAPGAADGDLFGISVAVDRGRIAVGASSTDLERDDMGVVHLFETAGDGGVESTATLKATDGELADGFGASVALDGDAVIVGAPRVLLSELNEGAAYLFERDGSGWRQVARFRRESVGKNDMAGVAVGLDGNVAVVGAPGADVAGTDSGVVLVYERGREGWTRTATLTPDSASERFGAAVAVEGDRILVGASGNVPAKETTGSAYLFERTPEGWQETARLTPSDGAGGDGFGDAVALAGSRALVGARFADLDGSDEGAAYVFEQLAEGWRQVDTLTAPEPSDRDQFGHAVALVGDVALVGAPRVDDPGRDSGAVWAFVKGEEGWALRNRLTPLEAEDYDNFGTAVSADDHMVIVGAPEDIPSQVEGEVVTGTATLFRNHGGTAKIQD